MFLTLVGSLISNWLITNANERTKAALAESQLRAEEAERRFQQARQAADLLIEVSEKELPDKPPAQSLRKRLLETAIAYYKDFISQRRGDASGQAELVAVQDRLKKILDDLNGSGRCGPVYLTFRSSRSSRPRARATPSDGESKPFARSLPRGGSILCTTSINRRRLPVGRSSWNSPVPTIMPCAPRSPQVQLQRLEQITLQVHGPMAFGQADIAKRLHLTAAQRQAIREIAMDAFAPPWDPMSPGSSHPPTGGSSAAIMQSVMAKVLAVLTPEQLAQWKKLTGPPFKDVSELLPSWPRFAP